VREGAADHGVREHVQAPAPEHLDGTGLALDPLETWDACDESSAEHLEGMTCTGGLDLSSVSDLSALVLDFEREDGAHIWLPFFWMPKENIALRVKRDRVPYDVWERAGLIKATEGNVVDYRVIRADMNALASAS
jgi:phage terminase large subunit-like protein